MIRRARPSVGLQGFLLACLVISPAYPAAPGQNGVEPLRADERLSRPLQLPRAVVTGGPLLEQLKKATGAGFMAETLFLRRPLPRDLDGKPALEAMEHLSEIYGGEWKRAGDTYLFLGNPAVREALELKPAELRAEVEKSFRQLLAHLNARQLAELHHRGTLQIVPQRLAPGPRETLRRLGVLAIASPIQRARRPALKGEGFYLKRLDNEPKMGVELWTGLPGRDRPPLATTASPPAASGTAPRPGPEPGPAPPQADAW